MPINLKNRKNIADFSVRTDASADVADIYFYDEIGAFGITAAMFVDALNSITTKNINLHLNSPGGDVFEANAMFNALVKHNANVKVFVDGLAASAASYLALAGDEVVIAKNAYFMIHNPWGLCVGGADEMRKQADLLDKITHTIADVYVEATGHKKDEILQRMTDETWFTSQEAVDFGLANRIDGEEVKTVAFFNVAQFKNVPVALKRAVEDTLRESGLSRKEAKTMLKKGFDLNSLRDAENDNQQRDAELKEVVGLLQACINTLSTQQI